MNEIKADQFENRLHIFIWTSAGAGQTDWPHCVTMADEEWQGMAIAAAKDWPGPWKNEKYVCIKWRVTRIWTITRMMKTNRCRRDNVNESVEIRRRRRWAGQSRQKKKRMMTMMMMMWMIRKREKEKKQIERSINCDRMMNQNWIGISFFFK